MNDYYNEEWYDERWKSLSPELRQRAVAILDGTFDETTTELIRRKHAEFGHDWIHYLIDIPEEELETYRKVGMLSETGTTMSAHHIFGTQIRNLLRTGRIECRNDTNGDGDCSVCARSDEWPPSCSEVLIEGISDDELPEAPYQDWKYEGVGPRNWDDAYCQAVEAALGLREV